MRALVAEHGAGVEDFLRQGLRQAVADQRAADAGGVFRAAEVRLSPPRSVKVYISLVTTSDVSPSVRAKTEVSSKIGVVHSSRP